jgi:hypothetical protein
MFSKLKQKGGKAFVRVTPKNPAIHGNSVILC